MTEYPVMELFYSVQGEGIHTGTPAFFIRLGGCSVGCHWCDVKESWDRSKHNTLSVEKILEEVKSAQTNVVIITGGEPCEYDLSDLTRVLQDSGYKTHLETSGAFPITGIWDWVCISPKKFKAPLDSELKKADELKVVIYNKSDFEWALNHGLKVRDNCSRMLQPEWSKQDLVGEKIIEFVKLNPEWRISLQTHKFLNVP